MEDKLNIDLLLGPVHTKLLIRIINENVDLITLVKKELSNRGVGKLGQNVTFNESAEIWGFDNFISSKNK